jgi:hypothetical protein
MIFYGDFTLPRVQKILNPRILEPLHEGSGPGGDIVDGREVHIYIVPDKEVEALEPKEYHVSICSELYMVGCTCKDHIQRYILCPHIAAVIYLLWENRRFQLLPQQMRVVAQPPNLFNNFKQNTADIVIGFSGTTADGSLVLEQAEEIANLELASGGSYLRKQKLLQLKRNWNNPEWRKYLGQADFLETSDTNHKNQETGEF